MKLIFCPKCKDIVKLELDEYRLCSCEACLGKYMNLSDVYVEGPAIVLGIDNNDFRKAIDHPFLDVATIFRIGEPHARIIREEEDANES